MAERVSEKVLSDGRPLADAGSVTDKLSDWESALQPFMLNSALSSQVAERITKLPYYAKQSE